MKDKIKSFHDPDYIIMIKRMLGEGKQKSFLDSIRGKTKIIPIMQINAQNANLHIKKYSQTEFENINESVKQWFEKVDEERNVMHHILKNHTE